MENQGEPQGIGWRRGWMARKPRKKSTASGDDDEPSCRSESCLLSQSAPCWWSFSGAEGRGRWVRSHALGGSGRRTPAGGQRQRQRRHCGRYWPGATTTRAERPRGALNGQRRANGWLPAHYVDRVATRASGRRQQRRQHWPGADGVGKRIASWGKENRLCATGCEGGVVGGITAEGETGTARRHGARAARASSRTAPRLDHPRAALLLAPVCRAPLAAPAHSAAWGRASLPSPPRAAPCSLIRLCRADLLPPLARRRRSPGRSSLRL